MRIKNLALLCLSILLICSVLSGCGKDFSIVGVWDVVDNQGNAGAIDFNNNGTFSMESGGFEIGGHYLYEGEKLSLVYPDEDQKNYVVELNDNKSIILFSVDESDNKTHEETIKMEKKED